VSNPDDVDHQEFVEHLVDHAVVPDPAPVARINLAVLDGLGGEMSLTHHLG